MRKNIHGKTPEELIRASGKLKRVKRTGWYRKAGIKHCESVADHSFRTAILAAYFAEELGLDSGKAARMSLVHDLAEAALGDKMPEEKSSAGAHRLQERRVLLGILKRLPSKKSSVRFVKDVKELFESRSQEARLVWEVDKFEMGAQQREYLKMGYDNRKLSQFSGNIRLQAYLQSMLESYSP
ncbi:MAG: HD domain-containing protein [Nitrososphaerales archaeon]